MRWIGVRFNLPRIRNANVKSNTRLKFIPVSVPLVLTFVNERAANMMRMTEPGY